MQEPRAVPVLDYYDEKYRRDPHRVLREARRESALTTDVLGTRVLLRYHDVAAAFHDPAFGAPDTPAGRLGITDGPFLEWNRNNLLGLDSPEHTAVRAVVARAFTARELRAIQPRIDLAASTFVDAAIEARRIEGIGALAFRVPVAVLCDLLGVPSELADQLGAWARALLPFDRGGQDAADRAVVELDAFVSEQLAERARQPRADLLTLLAQAQQSGTVSAADVRNLSILLIMAGHETTKNLIGNALYHLAMHPEQWAALRAEPHLVDNAVEEVLRYESPTSGVSRRLREVRDYEGVSIGVGEPVFLQVQSANRDERAMASADRFDVTRHEPRHLTFGAGAHFCVGALLARLETRAVLARLVSVARELELDTSATRVEWIPSLAFRGLRSLPLRIVA